MTKRLSRLAPMHREQWDTAVQDAIRAAAPDGLAERYLSAGPDALPVPNAYTTLAHNAVLAKALFSYHRSLMHAARIDPRLGELLQLRVAWRTRSAYQWAQHSRIADRVGITAEELAALSEEDVSERWTGLERLVLHAADELVSGYRVSDDTWAGLAGQLPSAQLVELVLLVGFHASIAMAFNSFDIELDAGLVAD